MNWIDESQVEQTTKIREAGNRVIVVASQNGNAPDTFDIFDGTTQQFVVRQVTEKSALEFAQIWNSLIENGEDPSFLRSINLVWLTNCDLSFNKLAK